MDKRILFVGLSGIPESPSAAIQRILNLGKALASESWQVNYLNRLPSKNIHSKNIFFKNREKITVINSFSKKWAFDNKLGKLFVRIFSFFQEAIMILRINRTTKIDVLFIYTQFFGLILFYSLVCRLIKCRSFLSYVELRSSIYTRNSLFLKINDYLIDRYAFALCDSVNPISNKLEERVKFFYPLKPQIKIPPIFDFSSMIYSENPMQFKYFLFCGSVTYFEVIENIISAYNSIDDKRNVKLLLIISGRINQLDNVQKLCKNNSDITIESNISYNRLLNLYANAYVLLIPLRNNAQDNYRFPHKISEYTASKRPIITTNLGDIPYYFSDKKNAIICDHDENNSLKSAMEWSILNENKLKEIGYNGYLTGMQHFSHEAYKEKLDQFLRNLIKKN